MITVERTGPRSYLRGTSFLAKDAIRAAGGQWGSPPRAWWLADDAHAGDLAATLPAAPARADGDRERLQLEFARKATFLSRALYRGRPYYLVVEAARGRRGWIRLKLAHERRLARALRHVLRRSDDLVESFRRATTRSKIKSLMRPLALILGDRVVPIFETGQDAAARSAAGLGDRRRKT